MFSSFFFFNDTATTEIYTLSLHDALPISDAFLARPAGAAGGSAARLSARFRSARHRSGTPGRRDVCLEGMAGDARLEEHTSELQSRQYLVCRLLLEKKKNKYFKLSFTSLT